MIQILVSTHQTRQCGHPQDHNIKSLLFQIHFYVFVTLSHSQFSTAFNHYHLTFKSKYTH